MTAINEVYVINNSWGGGRSNRPFKRLTRPSGDPGSSKASLGRMLELTHMDLTEVNLQNSVTCSMSLTGYLKIGWSILTFLVVSEGISPLLASPIPITEGSKTMLGITTLPKVFFYKKKITERSTIANTSHGYWGSLQLEYGERPQQGWQGRVY